MAQYGVDGGKVNNYLQTPGIKWNTLTDLTVTEEGEDYYKDFIGIVSSAIHLMNLILFIVRLSCSNI